MFKVLAHRGASEYAPENTMEAFQLAIEQGADGFELDVNETKDGELVVIHDDTINRTSNGSGNVWDFTYEELKKYNFNKRFEENYAYAAIPTLDQVLELVKEHQLYLNIEIKYAMNPTHQYEHLGRKAVQRVKYYGLEKSVILSSFNHYEMVDVKSVYPEIKTGVLYASGIYEPEKYAKRVGADAIHPVFYAVHAPIVEGVKKAGVQINTWTVNDVRAMQYLKMLDVDSVITNVPDICVKVRDEQ